MFDRLCCQQISNDMSLATFEPNKKKSRGIVHHQNNNFKFGHCTIAIHHKNNNFKIHKVLNIMTFSTITRRDALTRTSPKLENFFTEFHIVNKQRQLGALTNFNFEKRQYHSVSWWYKRSPFAMVSSKKWSTS